MRNMHPLRHFVLLLCSSSLLFSYDLSLKTDTALACDIHKSKPLEMPKKLKKPESNYDKLQRHLSEYEGTMIKDMFVYSVDMFMPDEMIHAAKNMLTNRQELGFDNKTEKIAQTIMSDSVNTALATTYYYMHDITHISERIWKNLACNPEFFEYDENIEPQKPLLELQECDALARGVTRNGIVLPFNKNFPNAFYPYAVKPDGCSAEWLQNLYDQSNNISNDDTWLSKACNTHDRCYYTEGTTAKECNSEFIVKVLDACNAIEVKDTLGYMGMKNAFCSMKSFSVATGATACARRYFANAQKKQKAYNVWVKRYEEAYTKVKQKGQQ